MTRIRRAVVFAAASAAVASAGVALTSTAVRAAPTPGVVYVLSNEADGNAVLVFQRAADGTLSAPAAFATGGTGTGGGLGSQGAVIVDRAARHVRRGTSVSRDRDSGAAQARIQVGVAAGLPGCACVSGFGQ